MAGQRPEPAHLYVVDKAHKNRQFDQPEPSKKRPVPPERLSEDAKVIFERMVDRISELYPPSESHTEILTIYAENEELAIFIDRYLRSRTKDGALVGLTYETDKGSILARPEVAIMKNCRNMCKSILIEFGLTPSSQRNIKIEKVKATGNRFNQLPTKAENE